MSGMCSRCIITRNIFHHYRRQDFVVTSSFVPYLSSKQIRSNSDSYVYIRGYICTYIYVYTVVTVSFI